MILTVGVESGDAETLSRCATQAGFEVADAGDEKEAMRAIESHSPKLVMIGQQMVIEATGWIRALKSDGDTRYIPVIVIGSKSDPEGIRQGLRAGADDFITIPIDCADLMMRLEVLARHYENQHDLVSSVGLRGEQTRVLTTMLDFSRALAGTTSLDEALERIVEVAAEVCGCRRVSLMLPTATKGRLAIAKGIGIDRTIAETAVIQVGQGIAGRVFEQGHAIVVNSPDEHDRKQTQYETPYFANAPLVSAPLSTSGHIIGVLALTERVGNRPFTAQDLEYIDLIAGIAGSAIHSILSIQARDEARDSIVLALANLAEHRDDDTGRHVERVTRYSLILAEHLAALPDFADQIDAEFLHSLRRAAPLHDIGKVAIPDAVLLKPGRLNQDEVQIMRAHANIGGETIQAVIQRVPGTPFLEMAEQIARFHHEWFDGSGYPCGIQGEAIPLPARILALADVYDALTSRRVYKEAFDHEKAREIIIAARGTQFDPRVVDAFLEREIQFSKTAGDLTDVRDATGRRTARMCKNQATAAARDRSNEGAFQSSATPEVLDTAEFTRLLDALAGHLPGQLETIRECLRHPDFSISEALTECLAAVAGKAGFPSLATLIARADANQENTGALAQELERLSTLCRTVQALPIKDSGAIVDPPRPRDAADC